MSDLISRAEVEKAIKEFNKQRVDRIPKELDMDKHSSMCDAILNENVELLQIISEIPTACDIQAMEQELEKFKTTTWSEFFEEEVEIINLDRAKAIVRSGGKALAKKGGEKIKKRGFNPS